MPVPHWDQERESSITAATIATAVDGETKAQSTTTQSLAGCGCQWRRATSGAAKGSGEIGLGPSSQGGD